MTFDVAAASYERFMGTYARELARAQVALLDLRPGQRVLDVGAGTGALTEILVAAQGARLVSAIEPSEPFVRALRTRLPSVDVRLAGAERLPFEDATFDRTVAQLVVNFLPDPVAGVREMARVTADGGLVTCSVWDFRGGRAPVSAFWAAAMEADPSAVDESRSTGASSGELAAVLSAAGLHDVEEAELTVPVPYEGPEAWWRPFDLGVGPAGAYLASMDPAARAAIRSRAMAKLPRSRGTIAVTAWSASGRVRSAVRTPTA